MKILPMARRLKGITGRTELHNIVEDSLKKAFLWDEV
jgi:ABC-type phosphate transport system ATPase subunit